MTHEATTAGRQALVAWEAAQPTNYYASDVGFRRLLSRVVGEERLGHLEPSLDRFGALNATVLDPLVREAEHRANLPRLERWSNVGERTEGVVYGGPYHEVGRLIYGSGVISALGEPGGVVASGALAYLANQNGEAGHNCPVACTAGIVRALQYAGSDELKRRFLPGLLTNDYSKRLDGAQFLTEVQGGSDVGANACTATPVDEAQGLWRIDGEKWFCSNVSAALILMTARPVGAAAGTRGLGLFLVPRTLDDGQVNGLYIRRLKEKLGTRAMASGEVDFQGCLGWAVGPVGEGFHTVMNNVINTSRLYNAVGVLAMARRALVVAHTYSRHRGAFGSPIGDYPLLQETLVDMRSELAPLLAVTFELLSLRDKIDLGQADDADRGFFRLALNINKYLTSVSAHEIIHTAIEILAGNGTIESFSVLPRLLRDNVIYENWEGAHNTLRMQVLRDMQRLGVAEAFVTWLHRRFAGLQDASMASRGVAQVKALGQELAALADVSPEVAGLRMRPISDTMGRLAAAACYASQAEFELRTSGDDTAAGLLSWFWKRRIEPSAAPADEGTLATLKRLSASI